MTVSWAKTRLHVLILSQQCVNGNPFVPLCPHHSSIEAGREEEKKKKEKKRKEKKRRSEKRMIDKEPQTHLTIPSEEPVAMTLSLFQSNN